MSSATAVQPGTAPARPKGRATLLHVIRSEWTKLWSVRSTMWTLIALFLLVVGFGVLISWGTESNLNQMPPDQRASFDPTGISLTGIFFGQLALAVLGAMVITAEYSTGGIRTTLSAVPKRLRMLAAKALVLAVVAWVVGTVVSFVAFFAGQAFLDKANVGTTLSEPGVLRAVMGGGLYLLGSAMFGFALGALLRHTPAAITMVVALLLIVPPFMQLLPGEWGKTVNQWFTANAGSQITFVNPQANSLGPWQGYAVFTAYWVLILAVAAFLLERRDA